MLPFFVSRLVLQKFSILLSSWSFPSDFQIRGLYGGQVEKKNQNRYKCLLVHISIPLFLAVKKGFLTKPLQRRK